MTTEELGLTETVAVVGMLALWIGITGAVEEEAEEAGGARRKGVTIA